MQSQSHRATRVSHAERRSQAEANTLEAALQLVSERGALAMTLADVGERAGYSRSLPAHYFGSKDHLYVAALERVYGQIRAEEEALDLASMDPITGIVTLVGFTFISHQVGGFIGIYFGGLAFDLYGTYTPIFWGAIIVGFAASLVHYPIDERPLPRLAQPSLQAAQ